MEPDYNKIKELMEGDENQPIPPELGWDQMKDGIFDKMQPMKEAKASSYSKRRIGLILLLLLIVLGIPFLIGTGDESSIKETVTSSPKAGLIENEIDKQPSKTSVAPSQTKQTDVEEKQDPKEDQPSVIENSTAQRKRSKAAAKANGSAVVETKLFSEDAEEPIIEEQDQAKKSIQLASATTAVQAKTSVRSEIVQTTEENDEAASNTNVGSTSAAVEEKVMIETKNQKPINEQAIDSNEAEKAIALVQAKGMLQKDDNKAVVQQSSTNQISSIKRTDTSEYANHSAQESTNPREEISYPPMIYNDSKPKPQLQTAFNEAINLKSAVANDQIAQNGLQNILMPEAKANLVGSNGESETNSNPLTDYYQVRDTIDSDLKSLNKKNKQFILEGGLNIWNGIYNDDVPETANYETPLSSFQVQANYLNHFKNDYFLMAGLQFQKLESRFKYRTTLDDYLVTVEDTIVQVRRDLLTGQNENVYGDIETSTVAERRIIHHNSSNLFRFTAAGGKSWLFKSFQADVYVGAAINVLVENEGRTYYQGEIIDYSGKSNSLFENQWAVDVISGARLHYFLDQEIGIVGGFQFQQSVVDWSNQPDFKSYPFSFGLQFGISYRLD